MAYGAASCGTAIADGAIAFLRARAVRRWLMMLQPRHATCGTEMAYGASILRAYSVLRRRMALPRAVLR
eukprot:2861743-Rhodomonas_salina.1